MMGLLSAEGYKLIKSKSFYISIAVVVGVVLLMFGTLSMADRMEVGEPSLWEEISVMEIVGQIFSGDFFPCVLAVFVSIFVIGEYGSGMMKNVAGKGQRRWKIFLSKLIITELAVIPVVLVGMAACLLGSFFVKGGAAFTGEFWYNLTIYLGIQMVLEMALAAVFVLSGDLCRNYASGISLGIGIAAFPVLIGEGLNLLFKNSGFTPSEYWLVSRSVNCPYEGFTGGYIAESYLVAFFWLVLAAGLGIWHFSRADIK